MRDVATLMERTIQCHERYERSYARIVHLEDALASDRALYAQHLMSWEQLNDRAEPVRAELRVLYATKEQARVEERLCNCEADRLVLA